MLRAKRTKSIGDVLEEVEVLLDTHLFNEFCETKSSSFLKHVLSNQAAIDMRLFKKTWRILNCTQKTMKVIREVQENLLCIGKRKELITKKKAETICWCSKAGPALNAKHIISCCKRVSGEINARHDIVINILLNNILVQRGLISHEQKWEDGQNCTRRDHSWDRAPAVRRVEGQRPSCRSQAQARPRVAPLRLRRRVEEGCR